MLKPLYPIFAAIILSIAPGCVSSAKMEAEAAARRERLEREKKEEKLQKLKEREDYVASRPSLHPRIRDAILEESIVTGMTQDDVKTSWGNPKRSNRSVGIWGVHEQWIYHDTFYLYFENGTLTSWQEIR